MTTFFTAAIAVMAVLNLVFATVIYQELKSREGDHADPFYSSSDTDLIDSYKALGKAYCDLERECEFFKQSLARINKTLS